MNVPKLRFKEFDGEWSSSKLGEIAEVKDSARISNEYWLENGIPYLRSSDLVNDDLKGELFISKETYDKYASKTGAPEKDDMLFTSGGKIGVVYHKEDNSLVYVQGGAVLYVKTSKSKILEGAFLSTYFSTYKMKKYIENASAGGTIKHFTLKPANTAPISFPTNDEQIKIGKFFKKLDKKIQLQQQKIDLLQEQKKGFLQKMFPKAGETQPEMRFDGFTGDWEVNKLNRYLKTSKEKNINEIYSKTDVLSVSGDYGIVNQIEFQGRSFAGVSVAPYGVVEKGDIVYTKSPLKSNPYGIIKVNKGKVGIVSTLYAIYKVKANTDANFIEYYFANDFRLNKYLKPLVNKGAKNDMKVSDDNAIVGNVVFPKGLEEQKKITAFFNKLDEVICVQKRKLELLQQQKKGFMQQMFI